MNDTVTIEVDIDECAPFETVTGGLRMTLNFYAVEIPVVAEFTAVGSWTGIDPFEARTTGMVTVSHVRISCVYHDGRNLGPQAVEHAQFAIDNRYVDREELSDALSEFIRDEVVNVAEWQLEDAGEWIRWEHLLGKRLLGA